MGELAAVRDTVKAGPTEWNITSHNNKYCTTAVLEYVSSFVRHELIMVTVKIRELRK